MNWQIIVAGLVSLLVVVAIGFLAVHGLSFIEYYEKNGKTSLLAESEKVREKAPSQVPFILAALLSVVGFSIFILVPFLALVAGIASLILLGLGHFQKGKYSWVGQATMIGVLIAAVLTGVTFLGLFIGGFFIPPSSKEDQLKSSLPFGEGLFRNISDRFTTVPAGNNTSTVSPIP